MKFFADEWKMTAKTMLGFEEILAEEIRELGAKDVFIQNRAVTFRGDEKLMYRANFELRTALKILLQIAYFKVGHTDHLYNNAKELPWEDIMGLEDTFAIRAVVNSKFVKHSHYASLRIKDAIVDRFREKTGERPSIELEDPTFLFNVHVDNNKVTISIDSSGDSLHIRENRIHGLKAPLSEVLAAGMIKLSGWNGQTDFYDPMCGSGTLLTEAAMIACNVPPQANRRNFGFMNWPDFDAELLNQVKKDAFRKIKKPTCKIMGADISEEHVVAARENVEMAKLPMEVLIEKKDFFKEAAPFDRGHIIVNPPYGERLKEEDLIAFYEKMGDVLKHSYQGYEIWVISSDVFALKRIGLKPERKIRLLNGPLECSFRKFTIFEGTYNDMKTKKNMQK